MLQITKPIKKNNTHIAKLTYDNKPITFTLNDVQILNISTVENGYLLRIVIPKDDINIQIREMDNYCLNECISRNKEWFNNTLDENSIKEFFRPSLNIEYNTMVVGMENTAGRTPIILINGKSANSIEELSLKNMEITFHIDTIGVFFHKKIFGIKWNVKKLICNTCITELDMDRIEIENQWSKDLEEFKELIEQDCIKRKEYLHKTQNLLKEIKEIPEANKLWNEKCEILSKMISNYKSL